MVIDVHSHLVPRALIERSEFGIAVERKNPGNLKVQAWGITVDAVRENLFDPGVQIEDMDTEGINRKVAALPPFLFAYGKEPAWAREFARAANEAVAEVCNSKPDRFLGLGIVPMQDPPSAVEELRYCMGKLAFPGVELGTHVNGRELDGEEFSGFFAEADRLNACILIHPGNVQFGGRLAPYYLRNLVGNPLETTICASRLLLGAFFERYPRLRVCFSHGGGAFPFVLGRMRRGSAVRPELKGKSVRVPKGMYFDSITHGGPALDFILSECGAGTVVLGSDYPFDMGEADPVGFVRGAVAAEKHSAILEINPLQFLGLCA